MTYSGKLKDRRWLYTLELLKSFIYISNNLKEPIAIKIDLNVIVRDPEHTGALGLKYIHKMTLQSSTEWCKYKFKPRKKEYSTRRMKVAINTDRFVYPLTWDLVHWVENTQHCKNITPKNPHIYILLWNRKTITKHFPHPLICRDCFGRVPFCFITGETNSPHDLHQFNQIESRNHCPQSWGATTFSGNIKFTIHLQFYLPKMYLKLIFPLQPTSPIHNQEKMKQWVNVLPWKPRNLMLHKIIITENSNPNPNKLPHSAPVVLDSSACRTIHCSFFVFPSSTIHLHSPSTMSTNSSWLLPSPKNHLDKSEQEIISLLDQYLKI